MDQLSIYLLLYIRNIASIIQYINRTYSDTPLSREEEKMMKRSKYVIVSQILDICKGGANKTKIVYQANLNFRTIIPYIDLLIKKELLEVKQGKTVLYETTDKGISWLENFERISSNLTDSEDADRCIQSIISNH